ncbi:MAG TPA: ABC transporter permease subunit [Nitrospiraceae bacterium]|nr:ABC transporter permease subunit [Nitrospiraceae bacterium]
MLDRTARYVVSAGGIAVIVTILAIFFFIFREVTPLFTTPTARLLARFNVPGGTDPQGPIFIGTDDGKTIAYVAGPGGVRFVDLSTGTVIPMDGLEGFPSHVTVLAQGGVGSNRYVAATADGLIIPFKMGVGTRFAEGGQRIHQPLFRQSQPFRMASGSFTALAYRAAAAEQGLAVLTADGALLYVDVPDGDAEQRVPGKELYRFDRPVTHLALDGALTNLYAGTADGLLYHFELKEVAETRPSAISPNHPGRAETRLSPEVYRVAREGVAVSALGFLNGDRSLVVATADGDVSVWGLTRLPGSLGRFHLEQMHKLSSHRAPVTSFSPSTRDKGFVTADQLGQVYVHYATSEQTWLRLPVTDSAIRAVAFAPKSDGFVALDAAGQLALYEVRNPFPEVTFQTLFGAVWYEGYERPEHVWQSSSGSDEFEPKYGLMPLAFGTIKGTMYALCLAVPLAILSAVFTSQFMHPALRGTIKPVIEIMAALPTVVLGFLAGLWLAPLLERFFPALIGMFIVLPAVIVAMSFVWSGIPSRLRERLRPGTEALVLMPLLAGSMWLCLWANEWIEGVLFGGDFRQWVLDAFGVHYDQRNAVVVGIVMGFAIIPIIYSIAEEALSNVPKHLIAGSLALGATRWQTVLRLVLLAASPGIFSAMMIGFGRAVGETMIVLMATGNTPILDWSWSNGFRTLSANIAVEIPEAPHGGTLYRVLFLAALLLFILTFAINTVAEVVRQRLRDKYMSA